MDPLVSVVIPVFNRAPMIAAAVESCLAQTYRSIEVILVDDCSTDDLDTAVRPFVDRPEVHLVRHETNLGVSAARNSGVAAAKGAYVAFLDSDDAWLPTKLERQVAEVRSRSDRNVLCGTLTKVISDQGGVQIRPKRQKPVTVPVGDYLFVHKTQRQLSEVSFDGAPLIGGCFAQTSSYFLDRELALATPFRVGLTQYEDMAFLIDLGDKGVDFLLIEEPLTVQHNDDRPGRLGARDDLARGQQFLQAIGGSLSTEARLAFDATHLAHLHWRNKPLRTLATVCRAFMRGAIAPKSVVGILSRCILGQAKQKALRSTVQERRNGLRAGQST